MKIRQLGFTVAGIVALVIAFLVGRNLQVPRPPNTVRVVTISWVPNSTTDCEVDFPVASLRQNDHQIEWASTDKTYWVKFTPLAQGENPPPPANYTAKDPLHPAPSNDTVIVQPGTNNRPYNVTFDQSHVIPPNCQTCNDYYMYDVYDPNTSTTTPCKNATVERDTGVIVKR